MEVILIGGVDLDFVSFFRALFGNRPTDIIGLDAMLFVEFDVKGFQKLAAGGELGNQILGARRAVGLILLEFLLTEGMAIRVETDEEAFVSFKGGKEFKKHVGKTEYRVGRNPFGGAHDGIRSPICRRVVGAEKQRVPVDHD